MSGSVNVNINDKSCEKTSSAEKTYNMNAAETETKAPTPGKVATAASSVNDLNKMTDTANVQKDGNNISNEGSDKDVELQDGEGKDSEEGASSLKTAAGSEHETNDESGDRQRGGESEASPSTSDGAVVQSVDTRDSENKDSEEGTQSLEESLEKLKMNIEVDKTCQTSRQSVTGSPANHSSSDSASNEQNSPVEDQAGDKEKECAAAGDDKKDTSKEASDYDFESKDGPTEAGVQPSDKTEEDAVSFKEKGKSGADNEEKNSDDVEMVSEPEDTPQAAEGMASSVTGQSSANVSDTGSGQKEKDEENGEASGGAEGDSFFLKKDMKKEDENLKPSDFVPARLAAIKRQWSERDTQMYRDGYPGKEDEHRQTQNLDFYQGRIPCAPDGDYIDKIHRSWWDDHEWLEIHHGYIQWLFPIRESGMNWMAQELQLHEAEAIMADKKAMKRFKRSYEMMLNFYGIRLISAETGEVERARNWQQRFQHLNYSMHNYLRITRILKCLGELGLERFKAPFLRFMLYEAIMTGQLHRTLESCYNYWVGTVRDDHERQSIQNYAAELCRQMDDLEQLDS